MGYTAKEIEVGMVSSVTRTISESDVYNFGGITGDLNPAHFNEEYAKGTMFQSRIVHGMYTASLISTVLGMQLPGPGTIFLENNCKFLKPVRINDTITAEIEVTEVTEKGKVSFKTKCFNQEGSIVIEGTAVVLAPKE